MSLIKFLPAKMIALIALTVFSTGCATIYGRQNDTENVFFESNVEGVRIECSGETTTTPGNLSLTQSQSHRCNAVKEGYETERFRVPSRLSKKGFEYSTDVNWQKWGIWTLGLGVPIGWTVDLVSGAMRNFKEDRFYIDMKPSGTTGAAGKVVEKSVALGETLVSIPRDVARETTTATLDKTLHAGAEQIGLASPEQREDTEKVIEGKKIARQLEETE